MNMNSSIKHTKISSLVAVSPTVLSISKQKVYAVI